MATTVYDLPPEILILIGSFLNSNALVSSLGVCKLWNETLGHLKWAYITSCQWKNSEFPLRQSPHFVSKYSKINISGFRLMPPKWQLVKFLRHVRHFEWSDHFLINFFPPDLAAVLQATTNLETLSLSVHDPKGLALDDYQAINRLQHVKRLYLSFFKDRNLDFFPIEKMFDVFSRTKHLVIAGSWFNNPDADCPELDNYPSGWKCERIMIPIILLPLTRNCPLLKEVTLSRGFSFSIHKVRLSHLHCAASNIIKLDIRLPLETLQTQDLLLLLPSFKKLKFIGLQINSMDEIDFFVNYTPDKPLEDKLPLLEHLVIYDTSPEIKINLVREFSATVFRVLSQRTLLRTFCIHGIKLHPISAFKDISDSSKHWVRNDLEVLDILLEPSRFDDYQGLLHNSRIVYKQLSRCGNLRKLSISWGIVILTPEYGIMHFAGIPTYFSSSIENILLNFPVSPILTKLEALYMYASGPWGWSKRDIVILLLLFPNLNNILLCHRETNYRDRIRRWLTELGRQDISISYESFHHSTPFEPLLPFL